MSSETEAPAISGQKRVNEGSSDEPAKKKQFTIERNDNGEPFIALEKNIRVTRPKFGGGKNVDIRKFYEDKNDGKMKPTKKGIYIPIASWNDVKNAVETLLNE